MYNKKVTSTPFIRDDVMQLIRTAKSNQKNTRRVTVG